MMEKGLKIVTIGGGSSYTPELMEGFIKRYNDFGLSILNKEKKKLILMPKCHNVCGMQQVMM